MSSCSRAAPALHSHRPQVRRALVLALIVLVAGCARSSEPPPPAPGEPVRIVFKHQRMLGREAGAFAAILADFERTQAGIRIVSEPLPSESGLQHQFYVTSLEGGSADFDIMSIDVIWAPEYARAGWLADVSDRFPPERIRAEFFPGPAEAVTWEGRTWALPWFIDAGLLYWRKDLLAKHRIAPPKTWPEIEEAARAVLE